MSQLYGENSSRDRSPEYKIASTTFQANFKTVLAMCTITSPWPNKSPGPEELSMHVNSYPTCVSRGVCQGSEGFWQINQPQGSFTAYIYFCYIIAVYKSRVIRCGVVTEYSREHWECNAICFSAQWEIHLHALAKVQCSVLPKKVWNLSNICSWPCLLQCKHWRFLLLKWSKMPLPRRHWHSYIWRKWSAFLFQINEYYFNIYTNTTGLVQNACWCFCFFVFSLTFFSFKYFW